MPICEKRRMNIIRKTAKYHDQIFMDKSGKIYEKKNYNKIEKWLSLYFTEPDLKVYDFRQLLSTKNLSFPRNDVSYKNKQEVSPNYWYRQYKVNQNIYEDNLWISSDSLSGDFIVENRILMDRNYTNDKSKLVNLNKGERLILRNIIYQISVEVKVKAILGPSALLMDRDIGEMRFHILKRRWRKVKRKAEKKGMKILFCFF
jgi:hypothetical protein